MTPKSEKDLQRYLDSEGIQSEIIPLANKVSTVAEAAAAMQVPQTQIVKSLLFLVEDQPLLVVALGPDRVETSAIARLTQSDQDQIKLCPPDKALAISGFAVGTIPPLGLDRPLDILIDERIMDLPEVYAGGGSAESLLRIRPSILLEHSGGRLVNFRPAGA